MKNSQKTAMAELAKAIKLFGNKNRLARALKINRSTVTRWCQGYPVKLETAMEIQRISDGKISFKKLRPDLFRVN